MLSSVLQLVLSALGVLQQALRWAFRRVVHALPDDVRYVLSLLAFWPTALVNRALCAFSQRRNLWDRVDPAIVLGSVPLRVDDVHALHRAPYSARGVVNMCREWRAHERLYDELLIRELHLPTIDYDTPRLADVVAACAFIRALDLRGETAFVHCKAGRGRSTVVVLCYLVAFRGLSPQEADAVVRAARPQITRHKWRDAVVQHFAAHRDAVRRDIEARLQGVGADPARDAL